MSSRSDLYCSHSVPFYGPNTQCLHCEVVWHEEMARFAKEQLLHHERMLEILAAFLDAAPSP